MPDHGPGSVGIGLLFTFLLHFCQVALIPVIIAASLAFVPDKDAAGFGGFIVALAGFGITQFVYMLPAILIFRKRGQSKTVQGLLIGAGVTFLLCATCDGLLYMPKR